MTVEALVLQLRGGSWSERLRAVRALGKTNDPSVVPVLCDVLQGEDESLRRAAIEALGNLGDRVAVRALLSPCATQRSVSRRWGR